MKTNVGTTMSGSRPLSSDVRPFTQRQVSCKGMSRTETQCRASPERSQDANKVHKLSDDGTSEGDFRSSKMSRRNVILAEVAALSILAVSNSPAYALGFQKELKKKKVPLEQYSATEDGIKYYDTSLGNGDVVTPGQTITVHFDVNYKSLDVVSTRSARLLGGNRSVAEPFEFVVGQPVSSVGVKKINDSANGLFSGQAGVKPPPALSTAVVGMKLGGKRLVNVTPEIGYGDKGIGEIPPGATVSLSIELLNIKK